jgi:hypothetical protein
VGPRITLAPPASQQVDDGFTKGGQPKAAGFCLFISYLVGIERVQVKLLGAGLQGACWETAVTHNQDKPVFLSLMAVAANIGV